ncbi:hypothetical protein [Marinifilum breve]|uniref:hypothetical protein n=1 Tax=Marinifilum breve TaxID=2184082 RepID=UPI001057F2E7|nr:hypothetical protein [Marinifilum breve]
MTPNFEYVNIWLKALPLPLFDYAGSSNETHLTSTITGYIFYFFTGAILLKYTKRDRLLFPLTCGFMLLTTCAICIECSAIIQDINSNYQGQHMRIGPFLFLIIYMIIKKYPERLKHRKYSL